MALITFSIQHESTFDDARRRLETAVREVTERFGTFVQRVEWSSDRSQVRLEGLGSWIDMQVDEQAVHVSADILMLGGLLGSSVTTRLQDMIQRTFQPQLPEGERKT